MNWEKVRSLARVTFKNPNFRSLCELGKTWKYSLRPRFKSPNFEFIDEKLSPNQSFTDENKMGNLHKTGHISSLTW